jgi:pyruvate formate lyase activating enzyme
LNHQIEQTGQEPATPPLVAVLDVERCLGCGRCLQACPAGAITLSTVIAIDVGRCTGCGQCVVVCPQGAISLKARRDRVSSAGPGQADK